MPACSHNGALKLTEQAQHMMLPWLQTSMLCGTLPMHLQRTYLRQQSEETWPTFKEFWIGPSSWTSTHEV